MDNDGWTIVKNNKKKNKNKKKKVEEKKKKVEEKTSSAPDYDDWDKPTILRKRFKKMNINVATRKGLTTSVKKKYPDGQRLYKVEQENEDFSHAKVSHSFKIELMRGRLAKKMSQEDLAKAINVKKTIIIDYEKGTIIPEQSIISKLRKVLNINLPKK